MNRLVASCRVWGLLAVVAAVSGWAAGASPEQAKAISKIKELGGKVTVDQDSPDKPVMEVNLAGTEVTDAGLEHLKGFAEIQWLSLWNTQATDAGLEHLNGLRELVVLNLGRTQVTDAGLKHLEGLTSLHWLGLEQTHVTDAGVGKLQLALPNCRIETEVGKAVDYVVPRGNVAELVSFVKRLVKYRPKGPADVVEHRSKFHPALQEAAQRILKLEKDHGSEAYNAARLIVLSNRVYWFARAVPLEQRRIVAAVRDYLEEKLKQGNPQEAAVLAEGAAKAIQKTGQWDWAVETYESFAARLKTSDDARVFIWANSMLASAARLRAFLVDTPKPSPPEIAPTGRMTPIDLAEKANVGNTEWFGASYHGNGLAELPKGDQELCGVKFRITEKLMQLAYSYEHVTAAPRAIGGIPVNLKLHKIYILQGTKYANWARVPEGTQIAAYKVHYADGSEASIPVVFGQDVRDWWVQDQGRPVTRGRVAWTGSNPAADNAGRTLRFYLGVWENPDPDKTVTSLDFVKMDRTTCAPVCLAITAED